MTEQNTQYPWWLCWLLAMPLPLLFLGLAMYLSGALGPYWLGTNIDPAYQYLQNGLNLLQGIVPVHVDHPGTVLQLFNAGVITVASGFKSGMPLIQDVYGRPEYFMQSVSHALIGLNALALWAMGGYVAYKLRHFVSGLFTQAGVFVTLTLYSFPSNIEIIPVALNNFPETMLVFWGCLYVMCTIKLLFAQDEGRYYVTAILFALVSGLACATKITFAPFALLPLILLPRLWPRIIYGLTAVAAFLMGTMPIWSKFDKFVEWISQVAVNEAHHGSAASSGVDVLLMARSIGHLMVHQHTLFFFASALFVIICYVGSLFFCQTNLSDQIRRRSRNIIFILIVLCFILLAMISRTPSPHYIVPIVMVMGLMMGLSCWRLPRFSWAGVLGAALLIIFVGFYSIKTLTYYATLDANEQSQLAFSHKIDAMQGTTPCLTVSFFRSSSQAYALSYGLIQGGGWGHAPYSTVLSTLYPDKWFYHVWSNMIHNFTQISPMPQAFAQFKKMNRCMMMVGQAEVMNNNQFITSYREIDRSQDKIGRERLYLVTSIK